MAIPNPDRFTLEPHPNFPPSRVAAVLVAVTRDGESLALTYYVQNAAALVRPPVGASVRADGLWRTTCFELFLMLDDDERYVEFNFSPSTQWAAYSFDGYRDGMQDLPVTRPPVFTPRENGIEVTLDLTGLPPGELRMALTAVIEEEGGVKSYWSLAHPAGAPDFHHAACFAARLPAPGTA